jgi:hypothetical protein
MGTGLAFSLITWALKYGSGSHLMSVTKTLLHMFWVLSWALPSVYVESRSYMPAWS